MVRIEPRKLSIFLKTVMLAWAGMVRFLFSSYASADVLVTANGEQVETQGPWQVKGRQIVFTDSEGRLVALRASDVDLEASERATLEANKPPEPELESKQPAPAKIEPVLVLTNDDIGRGSANLSNISESGETRVFFGLNAFGFRVTVRVNGREFPLYRDFMSGGLQFFHVNHPNKAITQAAIAERGESAGLKRELEHFCLVNGSNSLEVEWQVDGDGITPFSFDLKAPHYSSPLLRFEQAERQSGSVSTSFDVLETMPAGFETILLE